ncbi:glycerol transporter [Apophysomyces ossiformis]|uniref:Glycerol transporter n=1 Tax=Apophysomyces ossiformis TaxID=679940 RepID=A0A8H7BX17_9FUNG|nr:glycerol transporter [Apophysomyces ossiformis]
MTDVVPLRDLRHEERHPFLPHTSTETKPSSPSRWRTLEFYVYYACVAIVIPYMIYVTYKLGNESHPNYSRFEYLLSEGWLFGRKLDNSDAQYRHFRDHIPQLTLLALFYLCLSHLYRRLWGRQQIQYFFLFSSLLIISVIHGANMIKILSIASFSYLIGRITRQSILNPVLTWTFGVGILFLNSYYQGYTFASIHPELAWLDAYQGIQTRWHVLFNFVMLRLVSYNMDYYWQFKQRGISDRSEPPLTSKDRMITSCVESDYNYLFFLAYVFYVPLYLCGPIVTYNDFISQIRHPCKTDLRYIVVYALRLAATMFLMEWTLHYLYVVAISKTQAWEGDTALEISMIGYFNLLIIWMKLLIPWRFFRLWALADGMWAEENMVRCMSNNFSAQRFWKSWHRTFNRWTIRYIYVPLGGSKYLMLNMWVVFTFVALWHDIELKLLAWGWLICFFLLPELIASRVFTYKKYGQQPYYRFICGIGAVANILLMMTANLVGFCVGLDGMKNMLSQIIGTVDGVQIMFEIRETEKRRGDPKWTM